MLLIEAEPVARIAMAICNYKLRDVAQVDHFARCCWYVTTRGSLSVVVDGVEKKEISAMRHQSSEESSIDAFNTKTYGMADPNAKEYEFTNMAREGQFPWMVSFQVRVLDDNSTVEEQLRASEKFGSGGGGKQSISSNKMRKRMEDLHSCSGSLISDKWILSSAHRFAGEAIKNYLINNKLKVIAGSHKVSSRSSLNRNLTIERIYYQN